MPLLRVTSSILGNLNCKSGIWNRALGLQGEQVGLEKQTLQLKKNFNTWSRDWERNLEVLNFQFSKNLSGTRHSQKLERSKRSTSPTDVDLQRSTKLWASRFCWRHVWHRSRRWGVKWDWLWRLCWSNHGKFLWNLPKNISSQSRQGFLNCNQEILFCASCLHNLER